MFDIVYDLVMDFIQYLLPFILIIYFAFGLIRKWL